MVHGRSQTIDRDTVRFPSQMVNSRYEENSNFSQKTYSYLMLS